MTRYDTRTPLTMAATLTRAREVIEMEAGYPLVERLGSIVRWRAPDRRLVELRLFPVRGGGTRLEIEAPARDDAVGRFLATLPRAGLMDELQQKWDELS